jgi:hypothetical protein
MLPVSAAVAAMAALAPSPMASAQPYGPDTCISGFVWREAAPGDNVCVTAVRDATKADNAQAASRKVASQPVGGSAHCVWTR